MEKITEGNSGALHLDPRTQSFFLIATWGKYVFGWIEIVE